jgi:hypothetical protein
MSASIDRDVGGGFAEGVALFNNRMDRLVPKLPVTTETGKEGKPSPNSDQVIAAICSAMNDLEKLLSSEKQK